MKNSPGLPQGLHSGWAYGHLYVRIFVRGYDLTAFAGRRAFDSCSREVILN